ncbi:uncharacterized protein LOC124342745 [Daphnia pulicaria]|uniref:uncharacterized protein LOC124342745 n=1 Tax=Daphnia pulicaria TaxID=35523 RepID=UPI001EEB7B04|nr:uncharacterized protein LOC124342745 [Daphnia pulicaria]
MKNNYFLQFFLAITTMSVCRAGEVIATSIGEFESKAACPGFLQNDATVPCWTLNGKCYCFSTVKRLEWVSADTFCRDENMRLLSIETFEEDQLIYNQVKSISQLPSTDYYWTSGKYSSNRWEWASTEPYQSMNYTNWYTGEPSHSQTGSFAYINFNFNNNGLWFDEIGPTIILFICESIGGGTPTTTDASTASTTTVTTKATTETTKTTTTSTTYQPLNCPNYLQDNFDVPCWTLGNKCYCFSQLKRDWAGADSFCRGGNMALLKIESSQENDLIYNHYLATPGITKDIYWTSGRYSRDGNKEWEWATTPPYAEFNYTNWSPNSTSGPQPDFCLPNGSDCNPAYAEQFSVDISFFIDGRWYDAVNTLAMKFICESIA